MCAAAVAIAFAACRLLFGFAVWVWFAKNGDTLGLYRWRRPPNDSKHDATRAAGASWLGLQLHFIEKSSDCASRRPSGQNKHTLAGSSHNFAAWQTQAAAARAIDSCRSDAEPACQYIGGLWRWRRRLRPSGLIGRPAGRGQGGRPAATLASGGCCDKAAAYSICGGANFQGHRPASETRIWKTSLPNVSKPNLSPQRIGLARVAPISGFTDRLAGFRVGENFPFCSKAALVRMCRVLAASRQLNSRLQMQMVAARMPDVAGCIGHRPAPAPAARPIWVQAAAVAR